MAYAAVTLTELVSRLGKLVGGKGNFWSRFELEVALNEALSVWQVLVGEFSSKATWSAATATLSFEDLYNPSTGATDLVVTGGTTTAPLPLSVWKVAKASAYTTGGLATYPKLDEVSAVELDYANPGWPAVAATTIESWAPYGLNKVVFPVHTAATLAVDYYRGDIPLPTSLTETGYVQLGEEELQAILAYAMWQLNLKCGTEEAFTTTKPLRDIFLVAAQLRDVKLRGSALYKDYMGNDQGESMPSRDAVPQKGGR